MNTLKTKHDIQSTTGNLLFPVFLKLEQLSVLIVGGGKVGLEKLNAVLHNSPATKIRVVSLAVDEAIHHVVEHHPNVELFVRAFSPLDLTGADVVIIAVNDPEASEQIRNQAKEKGKLVNVADKPELCDFYLASIVKKGNLKIAISTNGKSPTIAKRLKETFDELLPEKLDDVLEHMHKIREKLNGDFSNKVEKLNHITKALITKKDIDTGEKKWRRIATLSLFAFLFIFIWHIVFSYVTSVNSG